jgi:hypothetical protein
MQPLSDQLDRAVAAREQQYVIADPAPSGRQAAIDLLELLGAHQIRVLEVVCSDFGQFVIALENKIEVELWQRPADEPPGPNAPYGHYGTSWQLITFTPRWYKIYSLTTERDELVAAILAIMARPADAADGADVS